MPALDLDTIVSLAKRRGFVFPSAEIYGGFANTYDYGPLGVELKRNIRDSWWRAMVREREDIVGIDAAMLTNPEVWVASGHTQAFNDPLVDCKACRQRFRPDHIDEGQYGDIERGADGKPLCPNCGGELTDPRFFNLMFQTQVGPVVDEGAIAYLPPETAQGMFVNFENVRSSMRRKLPFGIAQTRPSFRNEITPGRFIFRTLEFECMEVEFFCRPADAPEWHRYWIDERQRWHSETIGIDSSRIRIRAHTEDELSHYSDGTSDIEYRFPWGWGELEGIANRTDFDLKAHSTHSGQDLTYFDEETRERFTPYVIEPALGLTRTVAVALIENYTVEPDEKGDERVVLKL
ncbi:MAG TPA: glycine--tRNA ligase, partial [Dehalococcoidia bacterium]|nr:glycine--tRNA ligase [Dehalococcoidia bacterium]